MAAVPKDVSSKQFVCFIGFFFVCLFAFMNPQKSHSVSGFILKASLWIK